jgi:uncharacterized protein YcbX
MLTYVGVVSFRDHRIVHTAKPIPYVIMHLLAGFANEGQLLLIHAASLADLQRRVQAATMAEGSKRQFVSEQLHANNCQI